MVDAGLGLGFDSFRLNAMRFEAWHQGVKNMARQGMGKPIGDVHDFHCALVEKAVLAHDVLQRTLGAIPPTRAMRQQVPVIHKDVFDKRYHRRMLGPEHGSRPASDMPEFAADVNSSWRCAVV